MSDEGFLKRWSRRKRTESPAGESPPAEPVKPGAEAEVAREALPAAPDKAGGGKAVPPAPAGKVVLDDEAVDPATLPPIESLGPDSDYTVFLKKGVPEAIRTAALRKAWMSDPFIRDFRGPAEYALDYTTSEFDLRPTDDVAKMLDRIFPPKAPEGDAVAEPPRPQAAAEPMPEAALEPPPAKADLKLPQKQAEPPTLDRAAERPTDTPSVPRRRHGGALPD